MNQVNNEEEKKQLNIEVMRLCTFTTFYELSIKYWIKLIYINCNVYWLENIGVNRKIQQILKVFVYSQQLDNLFVDYFNKFVCSNVGNQTLIDWFNA